MPEQRSSRTIRLASRLQTAWRRERRDYPVAGRLALIGGVTLAVSAGLAWAHLGVIAQLVGGLALLPLSLAAFVRLQPPQPWTDRGSGGWGHGPWGDNDGPWSPDEPALLDWDSFERQFRAYARDGAPSART